ncbi:MAG TPA: serine hydrolase domain-containing protein [Candidatus Eremiobacteraceae bacterium]|nr:serine hydrolase domain-containing protein [Candidatus Eremiobacteraceae bacterium]
MTNRVLSLLRPASLVAILIASTLASAPRQAPSTLALQMNEIMQARAAAGDFSGSLLVARDARILYQHAFGYANLEWKIPNDLQTKFEIGSMTKQFTALLVLQFVNEGRIKLDGRLSDYLPYYRKDTGSRVTIRQLLSHTSGIPNFISLPGFLDSPASRATYTVKDFVQKFCSGDLEFEPGTRFHYSNSGYFLLGAVLEQLSGTSYEQLLKDRIFTPVGMNDSGYAHSEAIIPHRAAGYERSSNGLQNARFYDLSIPFAAGALYSTVGDLFLWDQALYGQRLLPPNLRDLLFQPHLENYGFGWGILVPKPGSPNAGETVLMHGGAIFGFQSLIERIPKEKELIVLLDNTDSPKLLDIALQLRRVLSENH